MIEKGADIKSKDRNGDKPIHYAAKGNTELAGLLLDKKAEINLRDKVGKSALDFARQYMYPVVAILLVTHGAEAYIYKKDFDISPGLGDIEVHTINDHHEGVPEVA